MHLRRSRTRAFPALNDALNHYSFLLFIIIPPVTDIVRDAEESRMRIKKFRRQNVAKKRLRIIYTFQQSEDIQNVSRP